MAILRRSSLAFPRQWNPTQVPTFPVEIDRNHFSASALAAEYIPGGASFLNDLSGNTPKLVLYNNPSIISGANGPGLHFNSSYAYTTGSAFSRTALTIAITVTMLSTGSGENSMLIEINRDDIGQWGSFIELLNSNFNFSAIGNNTNYTITCATTAVVGVPTRLVYVINGTTLSAFINGNQDANSPITFTPPLRGDGTNFSLGGANPNGGRYANAVISNLRICNRAWTAAQVAEDNAAPFAMLRPVIRRQYYGAASLLTYAPSWMLDLT